MPEFEDFSAYLAAYQKDPGLAVVPMPIVADYLGITPAGVNAMIRSGKLDEVRIGRSRNVHMGSLIRMKTAYEEQVETVTKYLVKEAKKGVRAMFYEPVMSTVDLRTTVPADRTKIGDILGDISRRTVADKGVLLSVLVHRKTMGTTGPGPGFYRLAENLGYEWDDDREFVEEETDRVLEAYAKS